MSPKLALRLSLAALVAAALALVVSLYALSEQMRVRAEVERMVHILGMLHRPEAQGTGAPRPELDSEE